MHMGGYAAANALNSYKNDSILMARPVELVIMLYDGLIKKIKLAALHIEDKDMEAAHNSLSRAQDIVGELLHSLDLHYEVSNNLMRLYDYMEHELTMANMEKSAKRLNDLVPLVQELRDTWHAIRNEGGHMYSIEE